MFRQKSCFLSNLLGAGVLGHSLGSFGHGVLGQLSGEEETDSSLDLSGCDCASSVVVSQSGGLGGDALEDVIHEGVHDGHGFGADSSVGVDLLQDFVDVDGVRFPPPPLLLLLARPCGLGLAGGLLGSLRCWFGWHVDELNTVFSMNGTQSEFLLYEKAVKMTRRTNDVGGMVEGLF